MNENENKNENWTGTVWVLVLVLVLVAAMQVQPLHDHVVVQAMKEDVVTKSGIVIPDTVKEKPEQGKVLSVGPGKVLENGSRAPMSVKVGDTVLFKKYSPDEIKVDGNEYLVIRDSDILAVLG